ncbi:MAG: hypothetical protein IJ590_01670 [Rickettsiales bacterium]|nr:hypothetical protein [Rickettsiales bacterium]
MLDEKNIPQLTEEEKATFNDPDELKNIIKLEGLRKDVNIEVIKVNTCQDKTHTVVNDETFLRFVKGEAKFDKETKEKLEEAIKLEGKSPDKPNAYVFIFHNTDNKLQHCLGLVNDGKHLFFGELGAKSVGFLMKSITGMDDLSKKYNDKLWCNYASCSFALDACYRKHGLPLFKYTYNGNLSGNVIVRHYDDPPQNQSRYCHIMATKFCTSLCKDNAKALKKMEGIIAKGGYPKLPYGIQKMSQPNRDLYRDHPSGYLNNWTCDFDYLDKEKDTKKLKRTDNFKKNNVMFEGYNKKEKTNLLNIWNLSPIKKMKAANERLKKFYKIIADRVIKYLIDNNKAKKNLDNKKLKTDKVV